MSDSNYVGGYPAGRGFGDMAYPGYHHSSSFASNYLPTNVGSGFDLHSDDYDIAPSSPSPLARHYQSQPQALVQGGFHEVDQLPLAHPLRYEEESYFCEPHNFNSYNPSTPMLTRASKLLTLEHIPYVPNAQARDRAFGPGQINSSNSPRTTTGVRLRPVSDLPDVFRSIFKFGTFNAVQSSCFDAIVNADENLVITAPTGSGKTALFELAIIRMINKQQGQGCSQTKCVYVAPTKALCSERSRDWAIKFSPLGFKCYEFTGDTVQAGKSAWSDVKSASIIVTTGEKWDSLTRNWQDHEKILSQIQLFLVDEVHVLNEMRGSTLEVIISRMKARVIAVRFVLLSATVPNASDIAQWIGSAYNIGSPATVFEFGEQFRPCTLKRIVMGFPRHKDTHDFAFTRFLDTKLFSALQKHSMRKPILVFSPTRKSVLTTAERLKRDYIAAEQHRDSLPWQRPAGFSYTFHDKRLADLATCGIGIHHAGLIYEDRRMTEDLYLRKILQVVVCTSTLAVGVNLPAHLVVIHGVHTFQNNASVEYSDLDVMQMLGRAGRPQFDTEGIALILCETALEGKYQALIQGVTTLESTLHLNLPEHLNSEIALGTITNTISAKKWLRETFLFQRIRRNPYHYSLQKDETQTWEERVDTLVTQSLEILKETQLVEGPGVDVGEGDLHSTEFGDVMSKVVPQHLMATLVELRFSYIYDKPRLIDSKMGLILSLPERPSMRSMLELLSNAEELNISSLRSSEKQIFNKLRRHNDIRFELQRIDKTPDKVFLLIQAVLGGISLSSAEFKSGDSQLQLEAVSIFKHVTRIARAIVDVGVIKKIGGQIQCGLEVLRCLNAKAWEDRPVVLRQIEQIGEKSLKVLAEHGITSLQSLRRQDPLRIEVLLNRRTPFGQDVLASAAEIPQYALQVNPIAVRTPGGGEPVEVEFSVECRLLTHDLKSKKAKNHSYSMTAILTVTSELQLVDFRRTPTKYLRTPKQFECLVKLYRPSEYVIVQISSEMHAGTLVSYSYKPEVPSAAFPVPDTRPLSSVALDLEGLENDPEFWTMNIGSDEDDHDLSPPVQTPAACKRELVQVSSPHRREYSAERLPNGKYNCRDGIATPSRKRKEAKISNPIQSTNRVSEALESIHNASNVTSNLRMMNGQRLKVANKGKKRERPDFEIAFQPSPTRNDDERSQASGSELPEPQDIMTSPRRVSAPKALATPPSAMPLTVSSPQRPIKRMRHQLENPCAQTTSEIVIKDKQDLDDANLLFLPDSDSSAALNNDVDILAAFTSDLFNGRPQQEYSREPVDLKQIEEDEFSTLEAWLRSGNVDIV
ncbi:hypothetical protein AX16_008849 [Volvariella volvacea WC 439]|nr:hypothetical protein AX16_008849 [Volvariella volvacea WC 439]